MEHCPKHGEYSVFCRECDVEELEEAGIPVPGKKYSVCDKHTRYQGKGMDLNCPDCDRAALEAAGLTVKYEPLIVTPVPSRNKPGSVVSFINGQLCFFENDSPQPEAGKPVEVMITRCLWPTMPDGHRDFSRVFALLLRPVTEKYTLISHRGFSCSGSMCRTTASVWIPDSKEKDGKRYTWMTPGRTDIFVAENVNSRFEGKEEVHKRPGKVWVETKKLLNREVLRAEGLARVEDARYLYAVKRYKDHPATQSTRF